MKHMKMLQKLMEKKGSEGKMLSDTEKEAKMSVIKDLQDRMSDMMHDKLGGLKKVTVASNSPEGLEHGLDKANEMLGKMPSEKEEGEMVADAEDGSDRGDDMLSGGEDEESAEHEASESPEQESAEHEGEEDEADLDRRIQELMKKKAMLSKKGM